MVGNVIGEHYESTDARRITTKIASVPMTAIDLKPTTFMH